MFFKVSITTIQFNSNATEIEFLTVSLTFNTKQNKKLDDDGNDDDDYDDDDHYEDGIGGFFLTFIALRQTEVACLAAQ